MSAALLAEHSTYVPETIDCAPSAHHGEVLVAMIFVLVSVVPLCLAFAHRDVEFHARWALIVSGAELALFFVGMAYIATVNPCTGA